MEEETMKMIKKTSIKLEELTREEAAGLEPRGPAFVKISAHHSPQIDPAVVRASDIGACHYFASKGLRQEGLSLSDVAGYVVLTEDEIEKYNVEPESVVGALYFLKSGRGKQ